MALIAKLWLRLVGTLLGIVGVSGFFIEAMMLFRTPHQPASLVLSVFTLVIALYFIYVCYLVWRRFSPRAVRHICGNLAFFIWCACDSFFLERFDNSDYVWIPLLLLFLLFALYRVASRRLIHSLFKETA